MLLFDLQCSNCGVIEEDHLFRNGDRPPIDCVDCGGSLTCKPIWLKMPGVVGDECDIWIKNGLCNDDGTPRHYRSKADIRRDAKAKNLVNVVRHKGRAGGDKNKHTQRFV